MIATVERRKSFERACLAESPDFRFESSDAGFFRYGILHLVK